MENIKLAIVIPYYKIDFFEETLLSLVNQTDKRFNVYIGDDASHNSPVNIIDKYKDKINIFYKRYEQNLGGVNLIGHWNRCLKLINNEEWICMLPDDDSFSINVIEEFYKALGTVNIYNIKVFRFPVVKIDQKNNFITKSSYKEPKIETNINFYERVVRGKSGASLGDNIFHRESLFKFGGFVNFPKGWGSDHATILQVSQGGNICFLKNANLYFRMSGLNISSNNNDGLTKLKSRIKFAKWIKKHEYIFPSKPTNEFYKFFYWKAEYYILNEWLFDYKLFIELYYLRKLCFNSKNILPIIKVFIKKLIKVSNKCLRK